MTESKHTEDVVNEAIDEEKMLQDQILDEPFADETGEAVFNAIDNVEKDNA